MAKTLKQNMSAFPITASPQDNLAVAYARMKSEGVRHLPVTNSCGDLVGIISDRDFKRAMWPMSGVAVGLTTDEPSFEKDGLVGHFMSSPVQTISEETSLLEAVNMMIDQKISALVILRDQKLSGIVTHEDLLKVLAKFLEKPAPFTENLFQLSDSPTWSHFIRLLSDAGI